MRKPNVFIPRECKSCKSWQDFTLIWLDDQELAGDDGNNYWVDRYRGTCPVCTATNIYSAVTAERNMDDAEYEQREREAAEAWEQEQFEKGNVYQDTDGTWRTEGRYSPPDHETL